MTWPDSRFLSFTAGTWTAAGAASWSLNGGPRSPPGTGPSARIGRQPSLVAQVPEPSRIDGVTIRAELEPESSDRLKQAH
jgi:hypothetical protein